jgi:hypothetical protein
VTLAWDPSPGPNINGYTIYYGRQSLAYTGRLVLGNVTTGSVAGLIPGATYYFAATATDAAGLESEFSNEVSYTVPIAVGPALVGIVQGGGVQLTGQAAPGQAFEVLTSPDLLTWISLALGVVTPSGTYQIADPRPRTNAACYYLLRWL